VQGSRWHHGSTRIYSRNFNLARRNLLDNHVSGQHGADLILELQGLIGQHRVASAENTTGAKIDIEIDFKVAVTSMSLMIPKPYCLRGAAVSTIASSKPTDTFLTT